MIPAPRLVDAQLHATFGAMLPVLMKGLVDKELSAGIWVDGYEIAGAPGELTRAEGMELLDIALREQPDLRIDVEKLRAVVDAKLPQSAFARVAWLVCDDATFLMTDSLRVARFHKENMLWCSPRISFDGVTLCAVEDHKVSGLAWLGSKSNLPDTPFELNYSTGAILKGGSVP